MRIGGILLACLVMAVLSTVATATDYQDAKSFAKKAMDKMDPITQLNPKAVPGYQSPDPSLSKLNSEQLKAAAQEAAQKEGDVTLIKESDAEVDKFALTTEDKDILARADGIVQAAETDNPAEKPETGFCANGDCVDQAYDPNQDMADSMAKLSVFKEMKESKNRKDNTFFGGDTHKCSIHITNFKDCCADKGWGQNIKLASCDKEDKALAQQKQLNKCVRVDSYCSERMFGKKHGKCIKRKTTYCCYPTKLARLVIQQGKKQLGLGFGTPKKPQCGGLSLPQITQLDFGKMDFRDLVEDIQGSIKTPDSCRISETMQKAMADKSKLITNDKVVQGHARDKF